MAPRGRPLGAALTPTARAGYTERNGLNTALPLGRKGTRAAQAAIPSPVQTRQFSATRPGGYSLPGLTGKAVLVALEPVSGFLLVEQYAARRDQATWDAAVQQGLAGLPLTVALQV